MSKFSLFVVVLAASIPFLLVPVTAQDQDQSVLRQRLEKKAQSDFFEIADWSQDYSKALVRAKERESLVLAYFTRSYQP